MKTHLQLNKIIYNLKPKKVFLVASYLLLLTLFLSFRTINKTESKEDGILVNQILEKTKKLKKNRTIQLNPVNDNSFVIALVDSLYHYQLTNETKKLENLKQENNIDETVYKTVFTKKELSNYSSQKNKNNNWKSVDINDKSIEIVSSGNSKDIKKLNVFISKPIYSINKKFCLVYVKSTWSGIMVYKKEKGKWKEFKLLSTTIH